MLHGVPHFLEIGLRGSGVEVQKLVGEGRHPVEAPYGRPMARPFTAARGDAHVRPDDETTPVDCLQPVCQTGEPINPHAFNQPYAFIHL
jgi:hypothetical protein